MSSYTLTVPDEIYDHVRLIAEETERLAWEQEIKEMPLILDEPPAPSEAVQEDPDGFKQLSMFD